MLNETRSGGKRIRTVPALSIGTRQSVPLRAPADLPARVLHEKTRAHFRHRESRVRRWDRDR